MRIKQGFPIFIALLFGLLTLAGLLLNVPAISNIVLGWAGTIVAVALLLGVLNLIFVHTMRAFKGPNIYSGVLVLSMIAVFALAIIDRDGLNVETVFNWVQVPLEAALASLLGFFLLFAGFQLLKRQQTFWSILFILSAVLVLLGNAFAMSALLPDNLNQYVLQMRDIIQNVIVTAGMRGLLIGIALGTIILSIRMLFGVDRPYNK
jgi:hypothetical protein